MKKIVQAMISTVVLSIFTGCAWKVPETVSVKTDADYEFSLGTFEKELDQELDINKMMGDAGKNKAEITLYDYFPGKKEKNIQHFLLEVELLKYDLLDGTSALAAYDAASLAAGHPVEELTLNSGGLTTGSIPPENTGLDFNPSSLFSGLKSALGSDMAGKIEFEDPVLLYLYCEATEGMTADANLTMFYGDHAKPINKHTSDVTILSGPITNTPRPVYEKEENVIISDLEEKPCLGGKSIDIKNLINSKEAGIQEDDQENDRRDHEQVRRI